MKIALISDIHSNLFYLEEAIKQIEKEQVDNIYCLGDLVGYYDNPNKVIDLIREKNIICIKGNHEKYLLGKLKYNVNNENIYRIKVHRDIVTDVNLKYLSNLEEELKFKINNKQLYMTHSLPNDCMRYLYNVKNLNKEFTSKYDYYFFGHTHIPMITYQYGTCIVNPGSIGQPRDHTKKPSFAIVNLGKDSVTLNKVTVDIKTYCKGLNHRGYDESLIEILKRDGYEEN